MEIKPNFERVKASVRHEESDRVPFFEGLIAFPIQSQFLGRKVKPDDLEAQVEFWSKAGYDFIPITVGMMEPGEVTKESKISKVIKEVVLKDSGNANDKEDKSWSLEFNSFIRTREEFEAFPWEIIADLNYDKFEEVKKHLPEGMKVIAISGKVYTLTWMLMGFNHFAMSLMDDRQLVADIFNKVAEIQYQALTKVLGMDHVGAVWTIDDIAFGTGPIIMPEVYREFVFPSYKKMADMCHESGRFFCMHTDGDVSTLMAELIGLGVDVLHPIDPTCMSMHKMKEEFGKKICLAGNVATEMLQKGSPEQIRERVKVLLRDIAPGGGFLLSGGNSIPAWTKFENYKALIETGLEHGQYPISIQ